MEKSQHRRLWLAAHRYIGLAISILIMFAAATGCILCFEQPLDRWLNPELFRPHAKGSVSSIKAVTALETQRPDLFATDYPLTPRADGNLLVHVAPRRAGGTLPFDEVFLDRSDGRIDGYRKTAPGWDRAHLMRGVYMAHFTLLDRDPGRWLMGLAAFAWLLANRVGPQRSQERSERRTATEAPQGPMILEPILVPVSSRAVPTRFPRRSL